MYPSSLSSLFMMIASAIIFMISAASSGDTGTGDNANVQNQASGSPQTSFQYGKG